MKNPFKKENVTFKGTEILTPYQKAQQEWDQRIGSSRVQARNWRFLALLALISTLLLAGILLSTLATRKDHIYIAEVTKEGRVVNVAPLLVKYQPSEAQKEFFISHFIELIRNIPLDPVLAKKNWLTAYNFLSNRGAEQLNAYFRKNNPVALLGKKTVTTKITDMNPISPTTTHLDWIETVINANGQEEAKNSYSGVFTIIVKQPTKREEIVRNPLGIYIIDFNITQKETKN